MLPNVRAYLVVSAIVFGIVAVVHLARALNGWAFVVGPVTVPVAASWIGFVFTAALCVWSIRLANG